VLLKRCGPKRKRGSGVHGVIAASADSSAWSFGGSILTFAFPMLLFVVVASWLYVVYTKPELAPGHRPPRAERPMSYTSVPGQPAAGDAEKTEKTEQAEPEGGE
jgi:hypothetical protein